MKTPEQAKAEWFAKLDAAGEGVWQVPMFYKKLAWQVEGETALTAAMAHARSKGKTPLLIDNTAKRSVAEYMADADRSVRFSVRQMYLDLKSEAKTEAQLLKEARKGLVEAMRSGKTLLVAFEEYNHAPYTAEASFPHTVFDQAVVSALEPYHDGTWQVNAAKPATDIGDTSYGLFQSKHPFAAVIQEGDLAPDSGLFLVKPTFGVACCTYMQPSSVKEAYRDAINIAQMQLIRPTDASVMD